MAGGKYFKVAAERSGSGYDVDYPPPHPHILAPERGFMQPMSGIGSKTST